MSCYTANSIDFFLILRITDSGVWGLSKILLANAFYIISNVSFSWWQVPSCPDVTWSQEQPEGGFCPILAHVSAVSQLPVRLIRKNSCWGCSSGWNDRALGSLALCLESSRPIHLHNAPHLSHKNLMFSFLGGFPVQTDIPRCHVTALCPSLSLSLVFIPLEARKQQQESCAQADRVGVQAGPLCEHLFYIRNDISSQSIPFAWFSGNPLLADASRASSSRTFLKNFPPFILPRGSKHDGRGVSLDAFKTGFIYRHHSWTCCWDVLLI